MTFHPFAAGASLLVFALLLSGRDTLTADQLALLQDAGGWEYLRMGDKDNGIQTVHTCFDGHPHPDTCRGTLTLTPANSFVQKVYIHHQSVSRTGTYQLQGNQLAFFDEFGTRDGPYTVTIDMQNKSMSMQMPQVQVELQLEKEYKRRLARHSASSR